MKSANRAAARRIATALVESAGAACVNIIPGIQSVYRWQGHIQSDRESLLIIKAGSDRYAAIEATVKALHPYELPEIIAVPIDGGSPAYLAWLQTGG